MKFVFMLKLCNFLLSHHHLLMVTGQRVNVKFNGYQQQFIKLCHDNAPNQACGNTMHTCTTGQLLFIWTGDIIIQLVTLIKCVECLKFLAFCLLYSYFYSFLHAHIMVTLIIKIFICLFCIFSMLKRLIVGKVSSGQDKQNLMVYISLGK